MADDLSEYRRKRDTARSGEPAGGRRRRGPSGPVFVVQRHDASTLHFDFRLEIGGVLVSWAVPKGPSLDPRDKRLAAMTEDHPLDYAGFEGRIGEGYGAGTVVVWDTGTFENITEKNGEPVSAEDALAAGHLKFVLHGEKLTGAFALTHTKMGGDDKNWLLVKVDDEGADRRRKPATTQPESVLSGKTNEDFEDLEE
jgi:DNA ligase D-like protein (predicted 3'-phosphoesterase)